MSIKLFSPLFALCASAVAAQTDAPLSAIDWLNQPGLQSITTPAPNISSSGSGAATSEVVVQELDAADARTTGLIPAHLSGIPKDFWMDQSGGDLTSAASAVSRQSLPAGHDLFLRVLLSEAEGDNDVVVARAQALIDRGAVRAAHNLLGQIQIDSPEVFAALTETSLIISEYGSMCAALLGNRKLSDDDALYVFCLSRTDDWDKAVLNFFSLDTLGAFDATMSALLAADLDPELADDLEIADVVPNQLSPLEFRLRESVGQPVSTYLLPLKFAVSDLRDITGWKSQIEAAERLAHVGSLPAARLIEIYSDRRKSASGGVWERVGAVQNFQAALANEGGVVDFDPIWDAGRTKDLTAAYSVGFAGQLANAATNDAGLPEKSKMLLLAQKTGLDFDGQMNLIATLGGDAVRPQINQIKTALSGDLTTVVSVKSSAFFRGMTLVADAVDGDFAALLSALELFHAMGLQPVAEQLAVEYLVLEVLE